MCKTKLDCLAPPLSSCRRLTSRMGTTWNAGNLDRTVSNSDEAIPIPHTPTDKKTLVFFCNYKKGQLLITVMDLVIIIKVNNAIAGSKLSIVCI